MKKKLVIITVASPKGGGGKSTTTTGLAVFLSKNGSKVLCVDQDNIGSITNNLLGIDIRDPSKDSALNLYEDPDQVASISVINAKPNISLLQVDEKLENVIRQNSIDLFDNVETNLPKVEGYNDYDYIIFDTPAGNGNTVFASLIVSDVFFTPIDLEQNSISAVKQLTKIIKPIKRRFNPDLHFAGFAINRVAKFMIDDEGNKIPQYKGQREIYNKLLEDYGKEQFIGLIGTRDSIVQAVSNGEWIKCRDDSSREGEIELRSLYERLLDIINKKRI